MQQDWHGANVTSGSGGEGGRGGDVGSHNATTNSNNVNSTTINFYGPQFIVNSDGKALDLSALNDYTVISQPFHGGANQQWTLLGDGAGKFALKSEHNGSFVSVKGSQQTAELVGVDDPFYWDITKDEEGYKFIAPNTGLALGLGSSAANLRPPTDKSTKIYVLEVTPDNREAIKKGQVVPVPAKQLATPAQLPMLGLNFIINDFSGGSAKVVDAVKDLQGFLASDTSKNLIICLGGHCLLPPSHLSADSTLSLEPGQAENRNLPKIYPESWDVAFKSIVGFGETVVNFINRLGVAAKLHWVDYEGNCDLHCVTIKPGQIHRQSTFGHHVWAVVVENKFHKFYKAFEMEANAILESDLLLKAGKVYHIANVGIPMFLENFGGNKIQTALHTSFRQSKWALESVDGKWALKNQQYSGYLGLNSRCLRDGNPLQSVPTPFLWDLRLDGPDGSYSLYSVDGYTPLVVALQKWVDFPYYGRVVISNVGSGKLQGWRFIEV